MKHLQGNIALCFMLFMQRMLHWVNKSTSSNVIFERDIIFLYKYHYNKRCKPVLMMWPESARASVWRHFCCSQYSASVAQGMTLHFSPLMRTAGNCRGKEAPRIFSGGWWSTAPGPDPWPGHSGQLLAPTKSSRKQSWCVRKFKKRICQSSYRPQWCLSSFLTFSQTVRA